jgi:hypothetical protein
MIYCVKFLGEFMKFAVIALGLFVASLATAYQDDFTGTGSCSGYGTVPNGSKVVRGKTVYDSPPTCNMGDAEALALEMRDNCSLTMKSICEEANGTFSEKSATSYGYLPGNIPPVVIPTSCYGLVTTTWQCSHSNYQIGTPLKKK